jgi:pimeloyl-ACP methyl ester carboxylesterase
MEGVFDTMLRAQSSPEQQIAAVDAAAQRVTTREGGCEIVWRMWGSGTPVLLLHGNFGGWSHWIRNIPFLAQRARIIAPDIPGFGESGMPPEPHSLDRIAALLRQGLRLLDLPETPIAVAGFSFGSTVAGLLARELEAEVSKLIIVSAGQVGVRRQPLPPFASWRKLQNEEQRAAAHRENLNIMMIAHPDAVDDLAVHLQGWNASRRRLATEALTAHHPLRAVLFELACPIHGIWGADDKTIGPFIQDRIDLMAQLNPTSQATIIEKAGHWVQYEQAAAFNAALGACLNLRPQP